MRTLFAKFLVGFWLALALFVGAETLLETSSLNRGLSLSHRRARGPMDLYADLARDELRGGGVTALDSLRERLEADVAIETFPVDSAGTPDGGHPMPSGARAAGLAALRQGGGVLHEGAGGFYVGYPIGEIDGRRTALVFHSVPRGREEGGEAWGALVPFDLGVRALVVLVLGGVGSFLLARSITAPVSRLRHATQRLAQGDFSARVGSSGRQDELEDLGRDFDRMAARLETLVTAQRRLLGDISHELRSPLARMNVALALLEQRGVADPEGMIARIGTEAGRLNQLIEDLLALSRVESGDSAPAPERVALDELIAGIVEDAGLEAGTRRCRVRLIPTRAVRIHGVPSLLRSAIENVVRNAIRHTDDGTDVEIRLARRDAGYGPEAVITVRDHGPGLPADQLEKIFEPFYRVDEARGRSSGGTGLGLAIAKRAVAHHGGRIVAASAPGGGLEVTLWLPEREAS